MIPPPPSHALSHAHSAIVTFVRGVEALFFRVRAEIEVPPSRGTWSIVTPPLNVLPFGVSPRGRPTRNATDGELVRRLHEQRDG